MLPLVPHASRHFLGHRASDEELRTALVRKKRQKIKHAIADALHPCSKYNARRALFFTGKEGVSGDGVGDAAHVHFFNKHLVNFLSTAL